MTNEEQMNLIIDELLKNPRFVSEIRRRLEIDKMWMLISEHSNRLSDLEDRFNGYDKYPTL